jgi:Zn-finger nucleic acid-binding protein
MNCPNCGAPMVFHDRRMTYECQYCSTIYIPEPDSQGVRVYPEAARHKCPHCLVPLVWADLEGFPAEICPRCRGLLFKQDLFAKMVKFLRAHARTPGLEPKPVPWEDLEEYVNCPACQQPMSTHVYGGPGNIVIDTCVNCQLIWLDYLELRSVLDTSGRDRAM